MVKGVNDIINEVVKYFDKVNYLTIDNSNYDLIDDFEIYDEMSKEDKLNVFKNFCIEIHYETANYPKYLIFKVQNTLRCRFFNSDDEILNHEHIYKYLNKNDLLYILQNGGISFKQYNNLIKNQEVQ